jgi:hypothetical protein
MADDVENVSASTQKAQSKSKVVPLRRELPQPKSSNENTRIEEMRQILREAQPTSDDELSDSRVIENERAFKERFGFVWPPLQRQALIQLKTEKGLTDPELKLLRWSGNLKRTPFGVTMTSAVWGALWGVVAMGYFSLLFLALFILAWPSFHGPSPAAIRAVLALTVVGLLCYTMYWFHILPWLIQRRTKRVKTSD